MPHSYSQLPVSIPSLFETIVSMVSAALLDELGREVQFLHGTYNHIRQRIVAKDRAEGGKELKYPLIALVHSFEEQVRITGKKVDVSLNFLICTETTNQKYAEDRYTDNYEPILYPIYAEFLEQCKRSGLFGGYGDYEHTKIDDLHMGEETANGTYTLPDVVDGLWVKDLKLTILPNKCELLSSGSQPAQLQFMSIVESVVVSYSESTLTISFNGSLVDTNSVVSNLYYLLHKGDGSGSIDVTAYNGSGSTSFSVATFADGEYAGHIESQDGVTASAKTYFWFKVLGGKVVGAMSNYLEYDSLKLDANKEGFDVNSSLVASDYVITAFDYTDLAGDTVYTHEVNGTVSQLANVRYEYNTGRSASYVQFKQKSRVSTKTLISTIIFKIN